MVSFNTAFKIQLVIGILFEVPVLLLGMGGFLTLMSDGKVTDFESETGKLLYSIGGIDLVKNLM